MYGNETKKKEFKMTMLGPEKYFELLIEEMASVVKDMSKAKTAKEKLEYSEIIKNLSEAMSAYISSLNEMMDFESSFDYEDFEE
jgi:predicted RNA-binding protein Jag